MPGLENFSLQPPWTFGGQQQQAPAVNPQATWQQDMDFFNNPDLNMDNMVNRTEGFNAGLTIPEPGSTGGGGFGSMEGWGNLLGGLGDLGGAYMSYKNYGLAKDQFKFQKAYANRNMENQSIVINDQLNARRGARSRFGGGGTHGTQVNGSPIG